MYLFGMLCPQMSSERHSPSLGPSRNLALLCPTVPWQVAGAAVLTNVLETVPAEDLLAPGKAKQVGPVLRNCAGC